MNYPGRWKDLIKLIAVGIAGADTEWIQYMILEKQRQHEAKKDLTSNANEK